MDKKELPKEVQDALKGKKIEDIAIKVLYKNWKGEVAVRTILPLSLYYGLC